MCVYGSLWAFADTRVGAPVVEAAHHPDFYFYFFYHYYYYFRSCCVRLQTLILFFSTDDSLREFSSFLKNLEDQRELMVRTTSQNLPGSQEKNLCLCLSVFFRRPAVSLITDRFTPAARVSRLVLFPSHVDQHFLWRSPLSQQRKAVSWWMVKSY